MSWVIRRIVGHPKVTGCKKIRPIRRPFQDSARSFETSSICLERMSAPTTTTTTTTVCSHKHVCQMSYARRQKTTTTTTTTISNMYEANISTSFSGQQQRQSSDPTQPSLMISKIFGKSSIGLMDALASIRITIAWEIDPKPNKDHYYHCHSFYSPFSRFNTKICSNEQYNFLSTKSSLPDKERSESYLCNNNYQSKHHQAYSSINFRELRLASPLPPRMSLVGQFMPTVMTNQLIGSKPVSILSNIITRLKSTLQGSNLASIGSGTSIEDEQEKVLRNSKGNKVVSINACGEVFAKLARTKPHLYGSAPKGRGIDFRVQYYDSLELVETQGRLDAPVVCLLHGAPGHYKDFASLINYLTTKGVRVVAPNFPDYSATFEHSFRHSPSERLDFLLEFFKAINLTRIDMVVGHSSAVYTIFRLLDHNLNAENYHNKEAFRPQVRSLGLFSVPSHELPPNMKVTPFRLLTLRLFDFPIMRPLILALIQTFVKLQGIQNRVDRNKIENLLIAASAVGYSEHETMKDQLELIHKFKIPTFMLFGTSDKLIPEDSFNRLKVDLGLTSDDEVKFYDSQGCVRKEVVSHNELVELSQFDEGGHYTFQRFSSQVNNDLYRFLLRRVIKDTIESTKL